MRAEEQTYLIALGGNMPSVTGPPEATLRSALTHLEAEGLQIDAVSRFFQTPCFPAGAGPDYVNAAARLKSAFTPEDVLALLHKIEAHFGRARTQRWGMRTLDLDIIASQSRVLPDLAGYSHWQTLPAEAQRTEAPKELILPHPRLAERAFVLVPLADIASDWVHPVSGLSVTEMLAALPKAEKDAVIPL